MAIVSSQIALALPEQAGRLRIYEQHAASDGALHSHTYMAEPGADVVALLVQHSLALTTQLLQAELDRNYGQLLRLHGAGFAVTLVHSTAAQWRTFLRTKFQRATRVDAGSIARYVLTFTDPQIKSAFGLNDAQLATLKARLTEKASALTAIDAVVGE